MSLLQLKVREPDFNDITVPAEYRVISIAGEYCDALKSHSQNAFVCALPGVPIRAAKYSFMESVITPVSYQ